MPAATAVTEKKTTLCWGAAGFVLHLIYVNSFFLYFGRHFNLFSIGMFGRSEQWKSISAINWILHLDKWVFIELWESLVFHVFD